LIYNQKGSKPE